MTPSRPVLRYHGGKWRLAPWIIAHFPAHRCYVEPFGGAASVLLQKPRVFAEVYNDLDGEIVNVFRVLRDRLQAAELREMLRITPFSRAEFEAAYEPCAVHLEQARRTIARSFMGFGSAGCNRDHRTGFRAKSFRTGTSPSTDWRNYPDCLDYFIERLQGVCLENRPALEVIERMDRADVLFYLDPPYVRASRYGEDCYRYEMTDAEHVALAKKVNAIQGMAVLSGYDCELYSDLFAGWRKVTRKSFADGARERVECLWLNSRAVEKSRQNMLEACI